MAVDWRLPENRRAVFHDFYEFHLRHGSHPGAVYFLLPFLRSFFGWDAEEALWFAFLNGNTQNPITSLILHRRGSRPADADAVLAYWKAYYRQLAWDTDRRYHKKALDAAVASYLGEVRGKGGTQERYWRFHAAEGWPRLWAAATGIATFGRLSAWSYLEYLRLMDVPVDCTDLMLGDLNGSRSHRNGLCLVLGLDRFDWHSSNPGFDGVYPRDLLSLLTAEAGSLLAEAGRRAAGKPWQQDVNYLTLESTLCTYKGWHRPNRRYANCLAGSTVVLSPEGDRPIADLDGMRYPVFNLDEASGEIGLAWGFGSCSGVAETVSVVLDDGTRLEVTPDHLFLTRRRTGPPANGVIYEWVPAGDLEAGQRLVPLHRYTTTDGYPAFIEARAARDWRLTHVAYFEFVHGVVVPPGYVVHHVNEDKSDSRVANLCQRARSLHAQEHLSSPDGRPYRPPQPSRFGRENPLGENELIELGRALLAEEGALTGPSFNRTYRGIVTSGTVQSRWGKWSNFVSAVADNHKVVRVDKGSSMPVYDVSVEGHPNFFVGSGVLVHNCYNDMLHDRIRAAELAFPHEDLEVFWDARRACLPAYLRLEDMPGDPGLQPVKQNWYRETGEVPTLGREYPQYWCSFDAAVDACELGRFRDVRSPAPVPAGAAEGL